MTKQSRGVGKISPISCSVLRLQRGKLPRFAAIVKKLALGLEGCAVGALGHGGVRLVSYHLDLGKRAVVLTPAMVVECWGRYFENIVDNAYE